MREDPACRKPGRNYRERFVPYHRNLLFSERRAEGSGKRHGFFMGHIFLEEYLSGLMPNQIKIKAFSLCKNLCSRSLSTSRKKGYIEAFQREIAAPIESLKFKASSLTLGSLSLR